MKEIKSIAKNAYVKIARNQKLIKKQWMKKFFQSNIDKNQNN